MSLMRKRSGFTLVELLIVVIILGVLAAVAIPQFTDTTGDAREATLDTNLNQLRNAIELYYHQHNNKYPGQTHYLDGSADPVEAAAESSLVRQLTLYSAVTGETSSTRDATYKYGPYIKGAIPNNPFNDLNDVDCDVSETDISAIVSDGTTGWRFYVKTGRLMANDGAHDSN